MKTLNNLFGKNVYAKSISDFTNYSMNIAQMNLIKGGTDPIRTDPSQPIVPPSGNI